MTDFRCGHASGADWREAADACAEQIGSNAGTLGFLYVTDLIAEHLAEILELLKARTGVAHWVGAVGIGVCATGKEYLDQPAVAVLTGPCIAREVARRLGIELVEIPIDPLMQARSREHGFRIIEWPRP